MAAPIVVPFNNQPINTGVTTASYTVPSGKYARVIVSIGLTASFTNTGANATPGVAPVTGSYGASPSSFNDKIELWLKSGDVLAFTTSLASGSISTAALSATLALLRSASSQTSATITLNASTLATFYATSEVTFHATFGSLQATSAMALGSFTGSATVVTHFEEFNVIS